MKKAHWQKLSIFILVLIILGLSGLLLNWYRLDHIVFDSHKWQTDINSRYDMMRKAEPIKPGTTEQQVHDLYGAPELDTPSRADKTVKTFCFRMPEGGQKGVYYIVLADGRVTETYFDNSGDSDYQEIEENLEKR